MSTPETPTRTIPHTTYHVVSDIELEKPYRVIIENDDVTPMDFVVMVLCQIFALDLDRAVKVMWQAHHEGHALVATLPFQEAQERVYAAHTLAREAGYPLSFYLEPDD